MKIGIFKALFLLFFLFNCYTNENQNYKLDKNSNYLKASRKLHYLFVDQKLDIKQIKAKIENKEFIYKESDYLTLGLNPKTLWVFFEIELKDNTEWVLEVMNPTIGKIILYQEFENQILQKAELGQYNDPNSFKRNAPNFQFELENKIGKHRIYLEISSGDNLTLPILIWKRSYLESIDPFRHLFFGFAFGIMASLAIYNFLLFVSIKDRTYLYYFAYIITFTFFFSSIYGYIGFIHRGKYLIKLIPISAVLTSVFALSFSRRFLNIKEYSIFLSNWMIFLIWVGYILVGITFFVEVSIPVLFANIHPFFGISTLVIAMIWSVKRKYKPAYYFASAWFFLLFGVNLFILTSLNFIEANIITQFSQLVGASIEAILLSLALGYRINDLRGKEENAQKEKLEQETKARAYQEKMTESFKRFVPEEFLKNLNKKSILEIERGDSIQTEMAILFSDIRGYTNFSENLDSKTLFKFLNEYLEKIETIIKKHDGFIDKFIGDAVMAIFPNKEKSILASLEMILISNTIQVPDNTKLEIGIGIHFGSLILGTLGSKKRIDTTVIGDTVNLASRIEGLNKEYKTKILVSEEFKTELDIKFDYREIDLVKVKGKTKSILIYEVFGIKAI